MYSPFSSALPIECSSELREGDLFLVTLVLEIILYCN